MKYFTKDRLYSNLNNEEYDKQWRSMLQAYYKEFEINANKLSKNLYKYLRNGEFHDADIDNISLKRRLVKSRCVYDLVVELSGYTNEDEPYHGYLIHSEVVEYKSSVLFRKDVSFYDYLYGEVLMDDDGYWTHEFLVFYDYNTFKIKCKKIEWEDIE